jgi:MFS family permease
MSKVRLEAPLLAAVFFDLMGFGMVLADFQLRAQGIMPPGWPTGLVIGLLLGVTFVTQILVSPHWGRTSDRLGRKPVMVACTVLSASAMLLYGMADTIFVMFVSRFLAGLGGANVAIAQALIADSYDNEARTRAIGRIGASVSAGLVIGPALGGFLAVTGGNLLVGMVGGVASMLGVVALMIWLPNPKPTAEQEPGRRPAIDLRLLREIPSLRRLALIASVSWFSLAMLEGTFARLINELFGYDQLQFGILFSYEAVLGVIVQAFLLVWVTKRYAERVILRWGYIWQGFGLALNPVAVLFVASIHPLAFLFFASTLFAVGGGLTNPTVNSISSRITPPHRQGELFGLLQSARSIGFMVGPMIGGVMFDWHPWAPYMFAGAVCLLAAYLVPDVARE